MTQVVKKVQKSVGRMQLVENFAILHLSNLYETPLEAVIEYVDNSLDAALPGQRVRIWVVRRKQQIFIIDDACGMLPKLLPDDMDILDMYVDSLKKSQGDQGDIRDHVNEVSLGTLEWLMEAISFSAKIRRQESDKLVRGRRGIGALAYRSCNEGQAVWLSRADVDRSRRYYEMLRAQLEKSHQVWDFSIPSSLETFQDVPTFRLIPPLNKQVETGDLRYTVEPSAEPLTDPFGNELEHGTRLEISDLSPDVDDHLSPRRLQAYLHKFFGEDIRTNRCVITVVDQTTTTGKSGKRGTTYAVAPSSYHGTLLIDRADFIYPRSKRGAWEAKIYYAPEGKGNVPALHHRGRLVCELTDLDDFKCSPWNSGHLTGHISYLDLSEQEAGWETTKKSPKLTPAYKEWLKAMRQLEDEISAEIAKIEDHKRSARQHDIAELASMALSEVVQSLPELDGLLSGPPAPPPPEPPRDHKIPQPNPYTVVRVLNEHNRGIPGIWISLWSDMREIATKQTGQGGGVSFGRQELDKTFQFRLQGLPSGISPVDKTYHTFRLYKTPEEDYSGIQYIFHVLTGQPSPNRPKFKKLRVDVKDWDQVTEPWRSDWLRTNASVEINSLASHYRQADEANDEDLLKQLIAAYCAAAIAEVADLPTSEALVLQTQVAHQIYLRLRGQPLERKVSRNRSKPKTAKKEKA